MLTPRESCSWYPRVPQPVSCWFMGRLLRWSFWGTRYKKSLVSFWGKGSKTYLMSFRGTKHQRVWWVSEAKHTEFGKLLRDKIQERGWWVFQRPEPKMIWWVSETQDTKRVWWVAERQLDTERVWWVSERQLRYKNSLLSFWEARYKKIFFEYLTLRDKIQKGFVSV